MVSGIPTFHGAPRSTFGRTGFLSGRFFLPAPDRQLASSALTDDCKSLGIDPAHWSRVKVGQAHFPQERLEKLMDVCGNEVPLRWLSLRRGYELTPMLTEMERRLLVEKAEKDRLAAENKILREMLTGRSV